MRTCFSFVLLLIIFHCSCDHISVRDLSVTNIKCNNFVNPTGVGKFPVFSWKTSSSPVTFSSIYGGEDYDARLENGLVPDIAPEYVPFAGGFRDSPEWGSATYSQSSYRNIDILLRHKTSRRNGQPDWGKTRCSILPVPL